MFNLFLIFLLQIHFTLDLIHIKLQINSSIFFISMYILYLHQYYQCCRHRETETIIYDTIIYTFNGFILTINHWTLRHTNAEKNYFRQQYNHYYSTGRALMSGPDIDIDYSYSIWLYIKIDGHLSSFPIASTVSLVVVTACTTGPPLPTSPNTQSYSRSSLLGVVLAIDYLTVIFVRHFT